MRCVFTFGRYLAMRMRGERFFVSIWADKVERQLANCRRRRKRRRPKRLRGPNKWSNSQPRKEFAGKKVILLSLPASFAIARAPNSIGRSILRCRRRSSVKIFAIVLVYGRPSYQLGPNRTIRERYLCEGLVRVETASSSIVCDQCGL